MARRYPHLRVHQDAGVDADDVVAQLHHLAPPRALDVVLQLNAEWPVVPHGVDAAVDLARRKDESATLGQRDDRVEIGDGRGRISGGRQVRQGKKTLQIAPTMARPVAGGILTQAPVRTLRGSNRGSPLRLPTFQALRTRFITMAAKFEARPSRPGLSVNSVAGARQNDAMQ